METKITTTHYAVNICHFLLLFSGTKSVNAILVVKWNS